MTGLLAGPYGYTVSLGGAAALTGARLGMPDAGDAVLFAVGAIVAFLLLSLWSRPDVPTQIPQPVSSILILNALPLVALGASSICTLLPWRPVAFWASGFATTSSYMLAVAVLLHTRG